MQHRSGHLVFSPGDLVCFYESPFASWMDRLLVERPDGAVPDEDAPERKLLASRGMAHERRYVDSLRAKGRQVWELPTDLDSFEERHAATLAAMRAGHEVIYQAALRHGDFAGYADILYRVPTPSKLGAWSYEVGDTKLARAPKPHFVLQLCAYAKMLEHLQGVRPRRMVIVNGALEEIVLRTDDYFFYFGALERRLLGEQAAFDPDRAPVPDAQDDHGRWQSKADEILERLDHPSRVAGITANQIAKLRDAGVTTLAELATTTLARVAKLDPPIFERLRTQARLQLGSRGKDVPLHEIIAHDTSVPRFGFGLLPPPSPMDVYFDMEGYPLVEGGLEYLFGATIVENGAPAFRDFWAHDRASEKRAFEVFVDLYRVVKQTLRIGEPRYSLKNVEHLYRPARAGEVATAAQSVVEYARWLDAKDGETWETSAILAGIRDYNREDCDSTWALYTWLLGRQADVGIAYVPPAKREEKEPDSVRTAADALAQRLLAAIPEDRAGDPERWRIQDLLARLVGFHRREDKPMWWKVFDRRDRTHEELAEDGDCLGGLERTATPRTAVKQSYDYEYRFGPDQDTKLHEGSKCFLACEELTPTEITRFDADAGLLQIKLGKKRPEPPARISLIPNDHVDAKSIAQSIARVAEAWERTGALPPALDTFLGRMPPRVRGRSPGGPLLAGRPIEQAVTALLADLESTALAIQGPPGAGKTRVAAGAIAKLAVDGKRIGISSNSHKAIQKLIEEVQKRARETGSGPLRITKVNRDPEDALVAAGIVTGAKSMKEVAFDAPDAPQIVGGTAWAFADPSAEGRFDYLFVDEAGQVSIANLVGMAPSAKNLVLLGDQMQLGQPIQGSHPGESGTSTLEYLLQEHRTIPSWLGVFLETTWRLHPELCRFISGAVYDDKLASEPSAALRVVTHAPAAKLAAKEAGIVFVPAPHEGNEQASDEEVQTIAALLAELRGRALTGTSGERATRPSALDVRDVLVVAPYNQQVRAVRAALPGVEVGSVDRFQGQEAPVVIVSMCASRGDGSTRGIEFLFSPNRLNVALSRAQSLAIVVGCPELGRTRVGSVKQMKLVNLFCRIVEEGR